MTASASPRVFGLIASALMGMIPLAPARGESVALTRTAAAHEPSTGMDILAGPGFQTAAVSPSIASALQLAAEVVVPPPDQPHSGPRGAAMAPAGPPTPRRRDGEPPKLVAVPEPTAMFLGLTSTLILGSLSWKRRLVHPPRD